MHPLLGATLQGTLFRFPLRTKGQAAKSEISKQVYSAERVATLLGELQEEAHLMLLFLKNIERLEVLHILPHDSEVSGCAYVAGHVWTHACVQAEGCGGTCQ